MSSPLAPGPIDRCSRLVRLAGALLLVLGLTAAPGCASEAGSGDTEEDVRRGGSRRDTGGRAPIDASGAADTGNGGDSDVGPADGSGGDDGGLRDAGADDPPPAPDASGLDGSFVDGAGVWEPDGGPGVNPEICPASSIVPTLCIAPVEEVAAGLCDGFDNDCDGVVDEGCLCKLGDVQTCFLGPPGRVNVGACEAGTQRCGSGSGGVPTWGTCTGGISPRTEVCDTLDNDCNGCVDELPFCDPNGSCPGPGDPRTPDGQPFVAYPLRGGDFFSGAALSWSWTIVGGPCDSVVPNRQSFTLTGATSRDATFTPTLSGSYTVTLRVQTDEGTFECTWIIHVVGPGVRIEMCYPESMTQDVDLLLMRTSTAGDWYPRGADAYSPNPNACSWWNCEASLRGARVRANWGYPNTPIANCSGGPQGSQWRAIGSCANPRLDIDNNLSEGTGVPENINIDNPRDGDEFRIMLHNFSGTIAHPIVNVYCGGRLKATFGAPPDQVQGYQGRRAQIGAMWRVADVRAIVDAAGVTTDCAVTSLHPPGTTQGYDVTFDNGRF